MATAGRYPGSAVLLVTLGLSPALGYATTFVLLGLAAIAAALLIAERFERAAHPSPTLPVKGRVPAGISGNIVPQTQSGTSPLTGEVGRGWATGWISPTALFALAYLLITASALVTIRTPADLLPLIGLTAPLFYASLTRLVGGAELTRYAILGAFVGLATAFLYRYGLGMPRAGEGFWLTDPYRLAVTTLLAAMFGLGAWFGSAPLPPEGRGRGWGSIGDHRTTPSLGPSPQGGGRRWPSLLALAAVLIVIALTGSRAALLGLPVLLLVTGLCRAHRPITRAAIVAATIAVALAALFVELPGTERVRLWDVLAAIASGSPVADPAIDIRIGLAHAATQLFAAAPLLGHGWSEAVMPQVLALLSAEQLGWGRIPHLHSDLAQFAVSGGLFGLAAYVLLLAAPVAGYLQLPRVARTPQRLHALLVLVIGAAVLGVPDTFLSAPMTLTIYVVLAAAITGGGSEPAAKPPSLLPLREKVARSAG